MQGQDTGLALWYPFLSNWSHIYCGSPGLRKGGDRESREMGVQALSRLSAPLARVLGAAVVRLVFPSGLQRQLAQVCVLLVGHSYLFRAAKNASRSSWGRNLQSGCLHYIGVEGTERPAVGQVPQIGGPGSPTGGPRHFGGSLGGK